MDATASPKPEGLAKTIAELQLRAFHWKNLIYATGDGITAVAGTKLALQRISEMILHFSHSNHET